MHPLNGRDLGIARQRLRIIVRPDMSRPATALERIESALAWYVNGDGVTYVTIGTLRRRIADDNAGRGLHRSTLTHHLPRLEHFVTIGYFSRQDPHAKTGAQRGVAIRIVRPDVAAELGFPPVEDVVRRLGLYQWPLLKTVRQKPLTTESVTTLWQLQRPASDFVTRLQRRPFKARKHA